MVHDIREWKILEVLFTSENVMEIFGGILLRGIFNTANLIFNLEYAILEV